MSYREKSAALTFVVLSCVYLGYFALTWSLGPGAVIPLFIVSTLLVIVLMAVGHAGIALFQVFGTDRKHWRDTLRKGDLEEAVDERDRDANLRSIRNAHYVLAFGIWIVPALALLSAPPLIVANSAFSVFVLSELVYYGSLVTIYRLGNQ